MATINPAGAVGTGAQGWAPGFYDKDDKYYVPKSDVDISKFPSINLRDQEPLSGMKVYDQGQIGSCVANANALAFWYELKSAKDSTIEPSGPSRYFIYWNALKGDKIEHGQPQDAIAETGTWNRHAAKILAKFGDCTENSCPYPKDHVTFSSHLQEAPSASSYGEASGHKIQAYYRLDPDRVIDEDIPTRTIQEKDAVGGITLDNVKRCLIDRHPVVFAFRYYWSRIPWEKGESIWRIPDIWSGPAKIVDRHHQYPPEGLPGHAVVAIGYDDSRQAILVQNSWGLPQKGWESAGGLFWMPYSWIKDFAATNDFWTLRLQPEATWLTTDQVNDKVQKFIDSLKS